MELKEIIKLLLRKKRGAYTLLVQFYQEAVQFLPMNIAIDFIEEDIRNKTNQDVKLNYFSFRLALNRSKTKLNKSYSTFKHNNDVKKKSNFIEFKDSHEMEENDDKPGSFKIK